MNQSFLYYAGGALLAAGLVLYGLTQTQPPKPKTPAPLVQPTPMPAPEPLCPNCPRPKRSEVEPMVDLLAMPRELRRANISSQGAGCCTFRSGEYAAWFQNEPALRGWPEWLRENGIAGGGTPPKQAALVKRIAESRKLPVPRFVQYEGNDPSIIELALKTGRPASITWDGNHMLSAVHLDETRGAIVDNNAPDRVQWFSREEFLRRWRYRGGWVFLLLNPPPAPMPRNLSPQPVRECVDQCPCSKHFPCECGQGEKCQCRPMREVKDVPGGVQWEFDGSERYHLGEQLVERKAVEDALVNDSARLHLSFAGGTPEARKQAMLALGADAARYLVQSYEANDWAVAGLHTSPIVTQAILQARDGKVLMRREGFSIEALRRSDPTYQPALDPSGDILPALGLSALRPYMGYAPWAAGGLGAALLALAWARSRSAIAAGSAPAPAPSPARSQLDELALAIGRQEIARRMEQPRST